MTVDVEQRCLEAVEQAGDDRLTGLVGPAPADGHEDLAAHPFQAPAGPQAVRSPTNLEGPPSDSVPAARRAHKQKSYGVRSRLAEANSREVVRFSSEA